VYHPVRVEVIQSLDQVHQLRFKGMSGDILGLGEQGTRQTNAVSFRSGLQVFNDVPIRRPLCHQPEGISRDAKALKDIWVI